MSDCNCITNKEKYDTVSIPEVSLVDASMNTPTGDFSYLRNSVVANNIIKNLLGALHLNNLPIHNHNVGYEILHHVCQLSRYDMERWLSPDWRYVNNYSNSNDIKIRNVRTGELSIFNSHSGYPNLHVISTVGSIKQLTIIPTAGEIKTHNIRTRQHFINFCKVSLIFRIVYSNNALYTCDYYR
jgi:hypothetical protein